jgi:P27 family predicted phage terminase small subunit
MQPGPRPLPKNIVALRSGKRARTAAPEDQQPEVKIKIPLAPDGLTAEEIAVFTRMARLLAGMRVMSEVDVDALVLYSRNWALAEEAQKRVRESSQIIKSPSGYPIKNPWCNIQRDAEDRCLKLLEQFGCTPSGRTRVSTL